MISIFNNKIILGKEYYLRILGITLLLISFYFMRNSTFIYLNICFFISLIIIFTFNKSILIKNKNKIFLFIISMISIYILHHFLLSLLPDQIGVAVNNFSAIETSQSYLEEHTNFDKSTLPWTKIYYIPSFIDNFLNKITILRNNFLILQYNSAATNGLFQNIQPQNSIEAIAHLFNLFFKAPFVPSVESWLKIKSLNMLFISFESFIFHFLFAGIIINYTKLKKIEILIIFFSLCYMCIILYLVPNLGSFIRYKQLSYLIILIISLRHWFIIFNDSTNMVKLLRTNNFKIKNNFKINSIYYSLNLLLPILIVSFVLLRDIIFIKLVGIGTQTDFYFILLALISFFYNSFNNPILDSTSSFEFKIQIKNKIYYLFLISFICMLLFSNILFNFFNININHTEKILFFLIILTIPLGSYYHAKFAYKKNLIFFNFMQMLLPIATIILFFSFGNYNLKFILMSILISIIIIYILLIFNNTFIKNENTETALIQNKNGNVIILLNQLFFNFYIIFTYYLITNTSSSLTLSLLFYKITFAITFFLSNIASSLFLPYISSLNDTNKLISINNLLNSVISLTLIVNSLVLFFFIFILSTYGYLYEISNERLELLKDLTLFSILIIFSLTIYLILAKIIISLNLSKKFFINNCIVLLLFLILYQFLVYLKIDIDIMIINVMLISYFLLSSILNLKLIKKNIFNYELIRNTFLITSLFLIIICLTLFLNFTNLLFLFVFIFLISIKSFIRKMFKL
tara:strand:- start:1548 stop:3785 length:2238 start_codon:yes stop_codon:yes gene_type:complete